MKLKVGDVEFGYDRAGSGEPVMLVMGLGTPRIGWFNQFGFLSQHFDVASFDNRGCGETVCASPWTVPDMAADAVGLADAFGWESFHLIGISMGGMISQELVLTHPGRVKTLTLMATTPGGPDAVPMSPEFTAAMTVPDPNERIRKSVELTFGEKFRRENPAVMELVLGAVAGGIDGVTAIGSAADPGGSDATAGYFGQVLAVVNWMAAGGSADRLKTIDKPTLVLHGGDDLLLPVGNGKIIAEAIPGAELRIWDDAGHALNVEYADDVNAELLTHLQGARV